MFLVYCKFCNASYSLAEAILVVKTTTLMNARF